MNRCSPARVPFRFSPVLPTLAVLPLAMAATAAFGQIHHVEAPQRVTRAVGVYEWTGDLAKPTAARFVPVSLFIDGHFQDAGLYLARPVPLALDPGNVYTVERAGEPQGAVDLDLAHRVVTGNALADDNPSGTWYAFGKFTPQAAPKAVPLHASKTLSKLESSTGPNSPAGSKPPQAEEGGDRPQLTRRESGSSTTSATDDTKPAQTSTSQTSTPQTSTPQTSTSQPSTPETSTPQTSTGTSAKTPVGSNDDDVDRPTLRRRDPSQDAARRKEAGSKGKTASVTAAGPALGDDPDRPILGHNTADTAVPELTGLPAGLHQAVAVSDPTHSEAHDFARPWDSPGDRAGTLAAMAALAKTEIAKYLSTNQLVASSAPLPAPPSSAAAKGTPTQTGAGLGSAGQASSPATSAPVADDTSIPAPPKLQRGVPKADSTVKTPPAPKPTPPASAAPAPGAPSSATATPSPKVGPAAAGTAHRATTAHRVVEPTPAHPAPLTLGQEELAGYTLSYGGLPTFVYTATASVAPAKASTPTTAASKIAYVTVVAQRLASGELQVALTSVTDNAHLDRAPQVRLVDAVDPDDSHRASLLLELRSAASRQFALYRLTSAHADETFTTASIE